MSFDIQDKIALVTGANRGIGAAIVDSLIANGASKVYLAVRTLDSTAALVEKYAEKVSPIFVDVSQATAIKELAQQTQDVQLVINNAGVLGHSTPLSEDFETVFQKELDINVLGLVRMAQAFFPALEKNSGAFVQLNSVASIKNFTPFTGYCASKAAAYSVTQGLKELGKQKNVHVLSVHPGPIETDMGAQAGFEGMGDSPAVVAEGIVSSLKAGDFHLFPDAMAKGIGEAYASFAENVVEAEMEEA